MSYRNPQQITNTMFNANSLVEQANKDVAANLAIVPKESTIDRYNKQQKNAEKSNKFNNDMYNKVGSLRSTGYEKFDQNQQDYFYDRIGKYVEIKNAMGNGTLDNLAMGNKALSDIEAELVLYEKLAPMILAKGALLQEAYKIPIGEAGSLSLAGIPSDQQEVLINLTQGGDVRIVNKDNQMFLYYPEGNDGKGAFINGNEFVNLEESGKTYIKTVPDISEIQKNAVKNTFFPAGEDNPVSKFVTFGSKQVDQGGGRVMEVKTKTTTLEQAELAMENMVVNGQFTALLKDDDIMSSVWTDKMGNDATGTNSWHGGTQEEMDLQDAAAAAYLAKTSVDEYLTTVGVELVTGTSIRNKQTDPPGSVNVSASVDFSDIKTEGNNIEAEILNIKNDDLLPIFEQKKVNDLTNKLEEKLTKEFSTYNIRVGGNTRAISKVFVDINDDGKIIITPSYTNAKGDQIDTKVYTLDKLDQLGRDLKKENKEYTRKSEATEANKDNPLNLDLKTN